MDEIILRTSLGADVGVELQDADDDGKPLWAIRAEQLLTTPELLALAASIQERYQPRHASDCATETDAGEAGSSGIGCTCDADSLAQDVARTLRDMRAHAPASRHYTCPCGAAVEASTWPNREVACSACGAMFRECGNEGARVLRKFGSDVVVGQAR